MKVLWIGSLAWKFDADYEFPVNGPGAIAGSCFEQNMIEGMESLGCEVDIISDYPYRNGRSYIKGSFWSHNGKSVDYRLPYSDFGPLSLLFKDFNVRRHVRKKLSKKQYDIVIVYLIHHSYMTAFPLVKKLSKSTKTLLICPDLPDMMDMSLNEKKIKRFLKRIDKYRISQKYRYVDAFVLFSNAMVEKLPVDGKRHIVIEGVSSLSELNVNKVPKCHAVLHAGTLHKNIGIENIIDSFQYIDDDGLQLWIFGDGELVEYIKTKAEMDSRIKYMGFVGRERLFEYLKSAKILINARNPCDNYTKYSFPSKTFEYIYSGTPFLTTKLEGIPDEYWEYVYQLKDSSPRTIAEAIQNILRNAEHSDDRINLARNFVMRDKGTLAQSLKLVSFVQDLF